MIGVPLTKETYTCASRYKIGILLILDKASKNPAGKAITNATAVTSKVIGTPDKATKNVSHKNL